MNFFKHTSGISEMQEEPKKFVGNSRKPVTPKSDSLIGVVGYFFNTLDPTEKRVHGEVADVAHNRFQAHTGDTFTYFTPEGVSDTYRVAFGSSVCKVKNASFAEIRTHVNTQEKRLREINDFLEKQEPYPALSGKNCPEGKAVMEMGETYLFAHTPNSPFVKGTFMGKEPNGMIAKMEDGAVVVFPFAITEQDYNNGRKDRLICAVDPRKMQSSQARQPQPSRNSAPRFDDNKGLVAGVEVMHSDDGQVFEKGVYVGTYGDKFLVENPYHRSAQMDKKYVIPFDIVVKEGLENGKKFILEVKDGKIFAPNFQRR